MKWIARLGDREETVEIAPRAGPAAGPEALEGSRPRVPAPAGMTEQTGSPSGGRGPRATGHGLRIITVTVGDAVLDLDVGEGLAPPVFDRPPSPPDGPGPAPASGGAYPSTREASVIHDGRQAEVSVYRLSKSCYQVSINGRAYQVLVDDRLGFLTREADAATGGHGGTVTAYMPGKVAAVLVEQGAKVKVGEGVVVLEAMKMENEIQSEIDGVVTTIYVQPGQAVEGGDALFEVAAVEDPARSS